MGGGTLQLVIKGGQDIYIIGPWGSVELWLFVAI